MADFIKPSHTQSSDEIVSALNSKIAAIATLSLNDGTWTNVPIGTVAFDPDTNQFKRKTDSNTWTTIEISLGIGSSLTIGTLNANSVTLLATPTSNNQTLTAASYKLLTDDVAFLKASTIELQTGTSGTDFNITTGAPSGEDLSSSSITKVINLPNASETARGAVTTGAQTFGGIKTFAEGTIKLGNLSPSETKNWFLFSAPDDSFRIVKGDEGFLGLCVTSNGNLGVGTTTPNAKITIQSGTSQAAAITFRGNNGTESTELLVGQGTDGNAFISQRANLPLYFRTNNLERVTIAADGRVGIGTTNPTTKLDLSGTTSEDIKQRIGTSSNYIELIRNGTVANTISSLGNPLIIETNDSRPVTIKTNGGERVRISENGLVGILTTTPEETLDVNGGIQSRSKLLIKSSPPFVGLIDQSPVAATNSAFLYADSGTFYLLRGTKGSQTWTHNSTNIWPLQINLNNNEAILGGNVILSNPTSKMGIGTSSPNEKLSIQSSAGVAAGISLRGNNNTTAGEVVVSQGGDGNAYLWNRSSSGLYLGTSNTTRMCIDAQGRLAVNTTPFAWNTSLTNATLDASGGLGMMVYAGNTYIGQNMYWNSSNQWIRKAAGSSSLYVIGGDGSHLWYSAPSGGANSTFSYTQTLSLNSSGDLTAARHIAAAGNISANEIYCTSINTNNNIVTCSHIHTGSYNNTLWQGQGAYMSWNNDSGSGRTWFTCNRGLGAGGWVFALNNGSAVGGASAVISASGSYWPSSDYRLKSNIVSLKDCLEKTLCLNPVSYTYNTTQTTEIGFIAHEVQQVVPEVVDGEKDAVYESGDPNYQALNYSALIPILTGAIQQLSQKLDRLEAELIELKNNKV